MDVKWANRSEGEEKGSCGSKGSKSSGSEARKSESKDWEGR